MEKAPLLGPQITGGELRLGPAFYYMQFIPSFFFGVRPTVLAMPDLIFSILFIPLLYLYLRLYFSKSLSLATSAIAAASLFLIIYGRFAWNPNSLPFFSLLAITGLIKTNWKNRVSPGWFYAAIIGATIATQLHFIYLFIALPLMAIYLFLWKPSLKLKHYVFATLIAVVFYFPVFSSEIKNDWNNIKLAKTAVLEKETKESRHNAPEKAFRAYQGMQRAYWGIITSDEHGTTIDLHGLHFGCNRECRNNLFLWIFQCFIFLFGIIAGIFAYRREKTSDRKKFIFAILLWAGLAFFTYTALAYLMYSRYYLAVAVPFFALLGISFQQLILAFGKRGKILAALVIVVIIATNLKNDLIYLKEHGDMAKKEINNARGYLFFNDEKITLEQLEMTADYIAEHKNSSNPIRIAVDNTYARPMFYLLQYQRNIPACYVKWSSFHSSGEYDYFLVLRLSVNEEVPEGLADQFTVRNQKKIGNLFLIDIRGKKTNLENRPEEPCLTS